MFGQLLVICDDELEIRYGHPLLVVLGVNRLVIQLL